VKISLITVCYNSDAHLRSTIESVLHQTYPDVEYILIDGNSSDQTIEIIREYEPAFHGRLKWISEPDGKQEIKFLLYITQIKITFVLYLAQSNYGN
jgi:glycosyltransferase involved in cell wall biosynthesis